MKIMRWGVIATSALFLAALAVAEDTLENTETVTIDGELEKQVKEITKEGLFVETFEEEEGFDGSRWFKSTHEKYTSQEVTLDEYTVRTGHVEGDKGLVLEAPAKHYGLAVKLDTPLQIDGSNSKKELVIQYELKLKNGLTCGGAYIKLLRKNDANDYKDFNDNTPFVIMFGPDKCGSNDKVHFIFQHKNPLTGKYEEKHVNSPPQIKSDRLTHLYTLVVRDDNTYEMFIDQKSVSNGSLLENFTPAVLPPKEIEDPNDLKPSDWVDEEQIPDPSASKPDDWDEDAPARIVDEGAVKPDDWLDDEQPMISDPSFSKPEDWEDEDDGDWVAPQIPNPKCEVVSGCGEWTRPTKANPAYKGKWRAPMIPNPDYKGVWKPRSIPNPDHFEDEHPARLDPIGALAVEVWTMSDGIVFDNFWLGNDFKKAEDFAKLTFAAKHEVEQAEQEAQREKDRKEMEERRANEGSFVYQVTKFANGFVEFTRENPVAGVGSAIVVAFLVILLSFFTCCASKADRSIETEKDEPEETKNDKNTQDIATEDESDSKQKLRQRKKAPVVRD